MCKVSVIIPVYNAEEYLDQCLQSIVSQTLKNIEIIIINDGSTDRSEEICKKYFADPRVIYYKKQNEGLAAARQDGIERAHGEYIGFVDSDDWIEPEMYEVMYDEAVSSNADIAFCSCYENESYQLKRYLSPGVYHRERIIQEILPNTLSPYDGVSWTKVIRWCNWLRLYKRSMIVENKLSFDRRFRRCQDLPFTFEATLHAQTYVYVDQYLYHNRVVKTSLSRGYTNHMWQLLKPLIERLYSDCEEFTDIDLKPSMDACTYMFMVNSIENEAKEKKGLAKEERIGNIQRIVDDSTGRKCLSTVKNISLNERLTKYCELIEKKEYGKLYHYAYYNIVTLPKKRQRKAKIQALFSKIPGTRKLYHKIKGC